MEHKDALGNFLSYNLRVMPRLRPFKVGYALLILARLLE
jgi:hypothetical protein